MCDLCPTCVACPTSGSAALQEAPEFELTTPMLAMFFDTFRTNGRIIKSMKEWRELAFAKGWLFEYAKVVGGSGKVRPDGSLDGTQDRSALKENLHLHADQDIDDDEYLVAIKSARELYDAKPKYGGSIRFFMLWDFLTIVAIVDGRPLPPWVWLAW